MVPGNEKAETNSVAVALPACVIMGKREREDIRGPARQFDDRNARTQADRLENDGVDQGDFNIWYGPRKKRRGKDKARSRCDPELDAGVTRGSEAGALEFCIFFARGACARGHSCHKLHFVPTQEDDAREDNMHDCFGRERSGVEDDDRDGVGCFLKENRTLWVGGVPVFDEASARERVRQNFGAWGRISSVRLVKNKSCAFVQYAYRANAEFAKEAMANQALLTNEQIASNRAAGLGRHGKGAGPGPRRPPPPPPSMSGAGAAGAGDDDGPVLHVRWAAEDPNPRAVIRAREGHAQTLLAAQVATGALPSDVAGRLPGADRALLRKMGMNPSNPSQVDLDFQNTQRQYLTVQQQESAVPGRASGLYPNTDHQYPNTDHQYPNTDHQYPNEDHQYPNTDHQYPSTDHQYPNTDHQYPAVNPAHPGASSHDQFYPKPDGDYYPNNPNTDNQYPSADDGVRKTTSNSIGNSTGSNSTTTAERKGGKASALQREGVTAAGSSARGGVGGSVVDERGAKIVVHGTEGLGRSSTNSTSRSGTFNSDINNGGRARSTSLKRLSPMPAGVGAGSSMAVGGQEAVARGGGHVGVAGGSLSLLGGYGSGDSD